MQPEEDRASLKQPEPVIGLEKSLRSERVIVKGHRNINILECGFKGYETEASFLCGS